MDQVGLFSTLNDTIRKLASQGSAAETWDFVCECADVGCHALVSLTLTEYDERRAASPPLPILAGDHRASL